MKIDLSASLEHNANELDRLARALWDAGLVMAATLIGAAAISVRDHAGRAGEAPPQPSPDSPDGPGRTIH